MVHQEKEDLNDEEGKKTIFNFILFENDDTIEKEELPYTARIRSPKLLEYTINLQTTEAILHWRMNVKRSETFNHSANIYLAHIGLGSNGE